MSSEFNQNLFEELIDQSHNPPGGDPALATFYAGIIELIKHNHPFASLLTRVHSSRKGITNKHLVNLIYRAYQAIQFERNDLSYAQFRSPEEWIAELTRFLSDPTIVKQIRKILLQNSTTTTIYQRYAGVYAICAYLFGERAFVACDLGCGGNYGLRGIELFEKFNPIDDYTTNGLVTNMLNQKLNLQKGISMDVENPDQKKVREWRLACSFYPNELANYSSVVEFEARIKKSKKVDFVQANLLIDKNLPKRCSDVVILSTILYQHTLAEQRQILKKATAMLKNNGILIVQDFASKSLSNPKHLDFSETWFGQQYSYRTFIYGELTNRFFWEVLKWNNGRCQMVKEGDDFRKFLNLTPKHSK